MTSTELEAFLHHHRDLVAGVIRSGGGKIVKEIGDSLLAVFESSTAALLASIEIQRQAASGSKDTRLGVRIMLAAGDVLLQDGDVFGSAVNAVSRLEALTPAGEIYFTEAVYLLCNRAEIASEPVDAFSLKGFSEPVRVHRTTFRHQTRELHDTAVLITDLAGFTRFALAAELPVVEDLMQEWTTAHEEAAAQQQGTVRAQLGDGFVLTFPAAAAAVRAWMLLSDRADTLFPTLPTPFALDFGTGLSIGTVRVFKSALYGVPVNEASRCQEFRRSVGRRCIIAPACAIENIPPQDLALLEVVPLAVPQAGSPDLPPGPPLPSLVTICRRISDSSSSGAQG